MESTFSNFLGALGLSGLSSVVSAIIVFLICVIAIKIITTIVGKALDRSKKMDGALVGFLKTALKIVLWVIAIITVAKYLGIDTASLVAVLSIAGLALSLSVQNILANLFSGITLLINHPFRQGDLVDIGANTGTVSNIGLFYTVIHTLDNRVVSIPNSDVTSSVIVNYNTEPLRRVDMTFDAAYSAATADVKAAILDAAQADSRILSEPAPFIVIGTYRDSSIQYIVRLWCKKEDYWDVYFGMNERVRESFEKHGVSMTYENVNVHIIQ
jgi:small conductance mechanosensitive channel